MFASLELVRSDSERACTVSVTPHVLLSFCSLFFLSLAGGTGMINMLEKYDLLLEDLEWLKTHNATCDAAKLPPITEEEMENLMDLFEKEAGKITTTGMHAEQMNTEDKICPMAYFPLARAFLASSQTAGAKLKLPLVEQVYNYWMDKRRRLGKALMRQFQEAPPRGNTDPHVAFRLRTEARRISKRNPRKDDISGYNKMQFLKRDFAKLLEIIDNVQTREQLKREGTLLSIHIFDAKLQASPWGQKMLAEQPKVAEAIAILNAMPPPPSTIGGAPVPQMPDILAGLPEAQKVFLQLNPLHPACSYNRAQYDAEARLKKASRDRMNAPSMPSASGGHKRSHAAVPSRPPTSDRDRGVVKSSTRDADSERRHREKEARKAARARDAEASGGASRAPLLFPAMEAMMAEEPEDADDDEDLLSEDEQDARFFDEVEAHVKRIRILPPQPNGATHKPTPAKLDFMKHGATSSAPASPSYASALSPAAGLSPSSATSSSSGSSETHPRYTFFPPAPPSSVLGPGSYVGPIRPVMGRLNRMWLEALVEQNPAMMQQILAQHALHQQREAAAYAQQQAMHAAAQQQQQKAASRLQQHPAGSSSYSSSSAPVSSGHAASTGAAPMQIEHNNNAAVRPQQQPQAIRAQ